MKKFLMGFLTGAVLFASIGVIAAVTYIANPVDFKVMVNGEEFISDPPALEVEGRTYLPLRAIGDALGVPVSWNEELRQAEVGTTSEAKDGYKTYSESKYVIDFGDFCGAKEVREKEVNDGYVTYYYDWDTDIIDADIITEYFGLMEKEGYTVKKKNDGFYYGMDYADLDKNMFSLSFGKEGNNYYVLISVFK